MEQRLTTNAESATAHHRRTGSGRTGWWRRNDEPNSTRCESRTTTVRVARRVGMAGILRHAWRGTPAADVTASRFGGNLPEFRVLTGPRWIRRVLFEPRRGNCKRNAVWCGVPLFVPKSRSAPNAHSDCGRFSLNTPTLRSTNNNRDAHGVACLATAAMTILFNPAEKAPHDFIRDLFQAVADRCRWHGRPNWRNARARIDNVAVPIVQNSVFARYGCAKVRHASVWQAGCDELVDWHSTDAQRGSR